MDAPDRKRLSYVLTHFQENLDEVLAQLEGAAGWCTERIQHAVIILGRLEEVPTGLRQLRRTQPLETDMIEGLLEKVPAHRNVRYGISGELSRRLDPGFMPRPD